jgi:hypothetical protein
MNDQRQPHQLDPAIEALRAERNGIDNAIRLLESLRDKGGVVGATASAAMVAMSAVSATSGKPTPPPMQPQDIPHGAFHGMGIQEAVKKLLLLRQRTMGAPELSTDLQAGGLHFASKSIASVLHNSFVNGGEIVRVSRGQWGLQEWYPNQRFNRKVTPSPEDAAK